MINKQQGKKMNTTYEIGEHFGAVEGFSYDNYDVVAYFDYRTVVDEEGNADYIEPVHEDVCGDIKDRCHHCNKAIIKGAVVKHKESGEYIVVGGDCAERFMTSLKFQEYAEWMRVCNHKYYTHREKCKELYKPFRDYLLKEAQYLTEQSWKMRREIGNYKILSHDYDSDTYVWEDVQGIHYSFFMNFLMDASKRLTRNWGLSQKQIALIYKYDRNEELAKLKDGYIKDKAKWDEKYGQHLAEKNSTSEWQAGRQVVEGYIRSVYEKSTAYGMQALVKLQTEDGLVCWFNGDTDKFGGVLDVDLYDWKEAKKIYGKQVKVTTTIKVNSNDPKKANGSRTVFESWKGEV